MNTAVEIKGRIVILVNGVEVQAVDNLIVSYGLATLAEILAGNVVALPTHIAVGTGSVAPVVADTTLGAEIKRALALKAIKTGGASNTVVFTKYFSPGDIAATVSEAGLFNAASSGNMFNRVIFTPVVVTAIDTFAIIWEIAFTNAA